VAIVRQGDDQGRAHISRAHDGDSCHDCSLNGSSPAKGFTSRG
jgi:hypothetical protein